MIITEKGKCPIERGMFGLFFEDINYALDGGLHAEMIENRSFEFFDCGGERYHWFKRYDGLYGWKGSEGAKLSICAEGPLYPQDPHYLCFEAERAGAFFTNKAYDGITLRKGKKYRLSFYARSVEEKTVRIEVCREDRVLCSENFAVLPGGWKKYEGVLTSGEDSEQGEFRITAEKAGMLHFDFISLKPEDALFGVFRKDLAETLKELQPGFLRFPGGCVVEGNTIDSMYRWKLSVGIPEKRKANWNRWAVQVNDHGKYSHYNQTLGVGYYEYFLLCEYLKAKPLPVCNVGMAC
ncbi:MAG: carbohydrate binding domain-containing protein [Erysipelotrichaceae bacterium]|nr:carbohydrate binding domain-containing protein [Erysipelotrichaceae bacterium]